MKTFDSELIVQASPTETYPRNTIDELIITETLNDITKPFVNTSTWTSSDNPHNKMKTKSFC